LDPAVIDNITWADGRATTYLHGLTLTHDPRCGLYAGKDARAFSFEHCDCFVSRVKRITFPDGTATIAPGPSAEEAARQESFRLERQRVLADALRDKARLTTERNDARAFRTYFAVIACTGWTYAIAQALGWWPA
jgi:hypothetical protein